MVYMKAFKGFTMKWLWKDRSEISGQGVTVEENMILIQSVNTYDLINDELQCTPKGFNVPLRVMYPPWVVMYHIHLKEMYDRAHHVDYKTPTIVFILLEHTPYMYMSITDRIDSGLSISMFLSKLFFPGMR